MSNPLIMIHFCLFASISDYEVHINNHDENCMIKCSSGFYSQVAKPCFSALDIHSVLNSQDTAMVVTEYRIFNDQNGFESTRFLRFSFMNNAECIGSLELLWIFKEQAKLKRFMIKDFNDAVRTSGHTDKVGSTTHDN